MKLQKELIVAQNYEAIIRKAFDCDENKHGAHYSFMRNLILTEREAKHLPNYDKQLERVKGYLSKAIKKLSKNKSYSDEATFFDLANERLKNTYSTSDLGMLMSNVLDKIIKD